MPSNDSDDPLTTGARVAAPAWERDGPVSAGRQGDQAACPISVVLPTKDRATLLERSLAALRASLAEGDEVDLGGLTLRALATPGHTDEHLAFVILDGSTPVGVFTGGSLIVGSAARTDLLGAERTAELARAQYGSLQRLAAGDDRIVFLGPLYDEDKEVAYRNAYFFVLPSTIEGMALVLLEARRTDTGLEWQYAVARMTVFGLRFSRGGEQVAEFPRLEAWPPTGTYFHLAVSNYYHVPEREVSLDMSSRPSFEMS